MLIGAKLPNSGQLALERGIPELAHILETAGVDSIWVSDHVTMPGTIESRYPFAADGRVTWSSETPYVEALIALALAAGTTKRVRLGTAVLVLPLRNPVMFAQQAASIDAQSGGRLELGVGAGWLGEEFAALNMPFARRGELLVEWIEIARACWTGRPAEHAGKNYSLPAGMICLPARRGLPILIGGHSRRALMRAGSVGDGWLAQQAAPELDVESLSSCRDSIVQAAASAGRVDFEPRIVLRIVESAGQLERVAEALPALATAGVGEVIVDLSWDRDDQAEQVAVLTAGEELAQ